MPLPWPRQLFTARSHSAGTPCAIQAHPFFAGVRWEALYSSRAPYQPCVDHELDTQNFENFPEQEGPEHATPRRRSRDPNFVGYTYKNFNATPVADGDKPARLPACLLNCPQRFPFAQPDSVISKHACAHPGKRAYLRCLLHL